MGRDRKKGKAGGRGGGGGNRMYIDNEEELAMREKEFLEQREKRAQRRGDEPTGDKEENDDEGDEVVEKTPADSVFTFAKEAPPGTKAAAEEDEEDEDLSGGLLGHHKNPNHNRQPIEADPNNPEAGLSRKQREALAAQKAKEDYMRRHLAGETEQARKDMERLALVRARREAAAKQREAEGRPPGWTKAGVESGSESGSDDEDDDEEEGNVKGPKTDSKPKAAAAPTPAPVSEAVAKKKALAGEASEPATAADGGPPKLKAMDIKKMNGDQLKDHLKARGLDIQGQKKDLMKRLTDYEAARP